MISRIDWTGIDTGAPSVAAIARQTGGVPVAAMRTSVVATFKNIDSLKQGKIKIVVPKGL